MTTLNFPISSPLKRWAQGRIDGGEYASIGAYINALIAKDRERREKSALLRGAAQSADKRGTAAYGRGTAGDAADPRGQKARRGADFKAHLAAAPLDGIDLGRPRDLGREIGL